MRAAVLSALAVLALAHPAVAAPAVSQVKVLVGKDLAEKSDTLGARELTTLSASLQRSVERRMKPTADGGTLTLVIEDAKANHPTPQQIFDTPGLSFESFGVGGASISGEYVDPAGVRTPIAYSWYESDIRWARYGGTWRDAETAFDRLAVRLSRDQFGEAR